MGMTETVQTFLWNKRLAEPSVKLSVRIWVEKDKLRTGVGNRSQHRATVFMPIDMTKEVQYEADRRSSSTSQILQEAWRRARDTIKKFPGGNIGPA